MEYGTQNTASEHRGRSGLGSWRRGVILRSNYSLRLSTTMIECNSHSMQLDCGPVYLRTRVHEKNQYTPALANGVSPARRELQTIHPWLVLLCTVYLIENTQRRQDMALVNEKGEWFTGGKPSSIVLALEVDAKK